ncbi:MAG: TetR/AcrR family transcriptional regulator [Nitrospirota bacterium]|nr:TetR/AcrR family transcriptional regulator [Nitrospirota bacterium]MDH5586770.1 TetR/AcrR family transcriptional regulator [Nitrospirota bacterium]
MASSERKKREYAQRETLVIDTARTLLLEVGYIDLNMDRIAELTEYSKGTIYQHFSCKEEILVQMLIQSAQQCGTFLDRGSQFRGTPRERVAAMALGYDLFIRLNPDHFKSKLLLQNESIRAKASPVFQKNLEQAEQNNIGLVSEVLRDAVEQGHVQLRKGITIEEVSFGLWAGAFGTYVLMYSEINLHALGISDPRKAVWENIHALLDGFGWHPFFHELNWDQTRTHILKEIFPQEAHQAGIA